ncbi:hypothetical protein HK105_208100 [Polyrhizophydium stewartii]|uniref:Protein kinase domain-containing protein n=1 Tax=Polyrhizophydium stewartii TaxID=2732419 RepID=A0ABR4MYN3_9FUNG
MSESTPARPETPADGIQPGTARMPMRSPVEASAKPVSSECSVLGASPTSDPMRSTSVLPDQEAGQTPPHSEGEQSAGKIKSGQHQSQPQQQLFLNRFFVIKTIGQGSYSKVKLAVALKIIDKESLRSDRDYTRIKSEVRIAHLVRHPNIGLLLEVLTLAPPADIFPASTPLATSTPALLNLICNGSHMDHARMHKNKNENIAINKNANINNKENSASIVFENEFVSGGDLSSFVQRHGPLNASFARGIFRQLVSAVNYLHAHFIIHRDIKPENILLTSHHVVKLVDFGFARFMDATGDCRTVCGSLKYCAPEVIKCCSYRGPEVDIWCLGVTLYMMLNKTLPFDSASGNEAEVARKICKSHPYPGMYLDKESLDLVMRMLRKDKARRPSIWDVAQHPWITSDMGPELPVKIPTRILSPDPVVLGQFALFGLGADAAALELLASATPTPHHALYNMLLTRKQRGEIVFTAEIAEEKLEAKRESQTGAKPACHASTGSGIDSGYNTVATETRESALDVSCPMQ